MKAFGNSCGGVRKYYKNLFDLSAFSDYYATKEKSWNTHLMN